MTWYERRASCRWSAEAALRWWMRGSAALAGGLVVLVLAFVLAEALPLLLRVGGGRLFTDASWQPTAGRFGIGPLVWGTLLVAGGAVALAAPLGIASAVFVHFYAPQALVRPYRRAVELLAGIPSVVYGLWALVVLVPLLARLRPPGTCLLAGMLVLAVMVLPTVALFADASLARLPPELWRGAAALGLGRWATVRAVALPAARAGLAAGVLLAAVRAVGETMAVLMVCGNVIAVPADGLAPVRALTAHIALEMGYAAGEHRAALFATGLVLLAMVGALVGAVHLFGRRGHHA
ncbi:MAG: phosphate transport system permease protein [Planctomycetota bacterium]|nr:MAG: phosphate transport system permease protein [Planctomycetota bacterium]